MDESNVNEESFSSPVLVHKGWGDLIRSAANEQGLNECDFISLLPEHGDIPLATIRKCNSLFYDIAKERHFFYDIAKFVTPLTFSSFSLLLWTSPDIETLLKNICDYSIFIGTPIRLSYHQNIKGDVELWFLDNEPLDRENHLTFLGSALFISIITILIKYISVNYNLSIDIKLMKRHFSDVLMRKYADDLGVNLKIGYSIRKICISKKYLYLKIASYDNDIYHSSLNIVRKQVGLINKKDIILQIYNYLNICEDLSVVTGESLALALNVHIRTLNRKLFEYGTSYRRVFEKYKLEQALHLLENPNLTMTEIAYRLGFSDLSAFSRAFKRWTGLSPSSKEVLLK